GSVSYIAMQVYEVAYHAHFRGVHGRVARLQAFTFTHLPSDAFLQRLPGSHGDLTDISSLDLNAAGFADFSSLLPYLTTSLRPWLSSRH
ncbi:hypothetical protein B0H21DRAFT_686184, partial [Amylocystis lapponica]